MNYVEHLNLFGIEAKEIPCVKGDGAPTTATEGAVGLLYMDTDTGDLYKCTAVTDGAYTWVKAEPEIPELPDVPDSISDTAKALLITILRNGIYSTDQSSNITLLETELAGSGDDSGNTGGDDSGDSGNTGTETSGTVVAMSAETVHVNMFEVGHYSDGGSTKFSDDRFPTTNGKSAVSEKVFEKDTKLRITLAPTGNTFQCMLFCSTLMDADRVLGEVTDDLFYWCESSNAGFAYAWSDKEHTWEYTVRAGYKFGVLTINAGSLPTKVEVA